MTKLIISLCTLFACGYGAGVASTLLYQKSSYNHTLTIDLPEEISEAEPGDLLRVWRKTDDSIFIDYTGLFVHNDGNIYDYAETTIQHFKGDDCTTDTECMEHACWECEHAKTEEGEHWIEICKVCEEG